MSRKGRAALSLVEVMIAVAIFVIAVLALISVQTFSLRAQVKSQQHQQATMLALTLMAEVEARVKADFDAPVETSTNLLLPAGELPEGYSYTSSQVHESALLQKVTLTILWKDRNGSQEYKLWTKFVRP